jgi:LmbE family N-acetylglucosaminyl deacetylase
MRALDDRSKPETVLAPMVELGAHADHIAVGHHAENVFGSRVSFYTTYVRGSGRTVTGKPFAGSPSQIQRKLRALACYRSQIGEPTCAPWFLDGLTEYLA